MPFAVFWVNTDIISCYVKYKRNKYCMMSLICEIYYMIQMNLLTKQKQTQRYRGLVFAKGKGHGGGMNWEIGIGRYKILYIEWTNNKVLLYRTGNYIQHPIV